MEEGTVKMEEGGVTEIFEENLYSYTYSERASMIKEFHAAQQLARPHSGVTCMICNLVLNNKRKLNRHRLGVHANLLLKPYPRETCGPRMRTVNAKLTPVRNRALGRSPNQLCGSTVRDPAKMDYQREWQSAHDAQLTQARALGMVGCKMLEYVLEYMKKWELAHFQGGTARLLTCG